MQRAVAVDRQGRRIGGKAETDAIVLCDGYRITYATTEGLGTVGTDGERTGIGLPAVEVEATANAIDRVIGICIGEGLDRIDLAGIECDTDMFAAAEKVLLLQGA